MLLCYFTFFWFVEQHNNIFVVLFHHIIPKVQESLAKEQSSRSADQKEHGEMLKELQELISLEREEHLTLLTKVKTACTCTYIWL